MNEVKRNARRKSAGSHRSGGTASRDDSESRWNRIKGRLAAKVAQVDEARLKAALLGCGVAVGIVVSAVIAIKLMPLAVLILGILGLAVVLRLFEWMRYLPLPF